jgi:hypothetical protein
MVENGPMPPLIKMEEGLEVLNYSNPEFSKYKFIKKIKFYFYINPNQIGQPLNTFKCIF